MISKHIGLAEATKSQEAIRLNLSNEPTPAIISNMQLVAEKVFEPLRKHFGKPIGISSFYRSVLINQRLGGSYTSQHCTGQAIDIDADIFGGLTNTDIFNYILANLKFDQLIWEFGNSESPAWVHVSYKAEGNRNQVLIAEKVNGITKYSPYKA